MSNLEKIMAALNEGKIEFEDLSDEQRSGVTRETIRKLVPMLKTWKWKGEGSNNDLGVLEALKNDLERFLGIAEHRK